MKNVALFTILLSLIFVGGVALAQETDLPNPGLTPDNPFYFLKTWKERIQIFFIFGAENKAKQYLHLSEVRLAEYQKMVEKEKAEIAEKTLNKYGVQLDKALEKAEQAKVEGKDIEDLAILITEKTLKHQETLVEVFEKVPDEAKVAIQKAIEVSQKGSEQAVQFVSKEKQAELLRQMEEIKARAAEKIKALEVKLKAAEARIKELEKKLEEKPSLIPTPTLAPTPTTPTITVLSPNGGEVWEVGKTYEIKYTIKNPPTTNLESWQIASSVGCATWDKSGGPIESHLLKNDTGVVQWTIPTNHVVFKEGSGCKVTIGLMDLSSLGMDSPGRILTPIGYSDSSDAKFAIAIAGTPSTLVPTCTDTDGGLNYDKAGTVFGLAVTGVEYKSTDQCVAVERRLGEFFCDEDNNPGYKSYDCPYGCSGGACRPVRPLYLLDVNIQPSAEEARVRSPWIRGSISCGMGATDCSDSYTSDVDVILAASFKNPGSTASWSGCDSVDSITGSFCTVSMNSDRSVTLNVIASKISITVLSPNGGESFRQGESNVIKWSENEIPLATQIIQLRLKKDGKTLGTIGWTGGGIGTFTWDARSYLEGPYAQKVNVVPGTGYSLEVQFVSRDSAIVASDSSDATFTIVAAGTPE